MERWRIWTSADRTWRGLPLVGTALERAAKVGQWVDNRVAVWDSRRHGRVWNAVRPDLASASLIAFGAGMATWWARRYYGRVGLRPSDADASAVFVVVTATVVSGLLLALLLVYAWALVKMVRSFATVIAIGFGSALLTGIVGDHWSPVAGLAVFLSLLAVAMLTLRFRFRRRVQAGHWRRVLAGAVSTVWIVIMGSMLWELEPRSYQEQYERSPVSLTNLPVVFAPLPDHFVINERGQNDEPLVVLSTDAWMTVINPCQVPPYEKRLVRYDELVLRNASFTEAMELCLLP